MLQVAKVRAFVGHVVGSALPLDAAGDPSAVERRRAFSLTHLAVGALPFAMLPPLLAFGQAPTGGGLAAFALLTAPIVAVVDLTRSGLAALWLFRRKTY